MSSLENMLHVTGLEQMLPGITGLRVRWVDHLLMVAGLVFVAYYVCVVRR